MTPRGEATSGSAQAQLLLVPAPSPRPTAFSRGGRAGAVGGAGRGEVMEIILTCFSVGDISLFATFFPSHFSCTVSINHTHTHVQVCGHAKHVSMG